MKVDHRYRVHLAVSPHEDVRPHLAQPWLDVAGKRLIATDGTILAVVPADIDKGDKPGPMPLPAAKKARWERVAALAHGARVGSAVYDRQRVNFPDVDAVVPAWGPGASGTVTVFLDPRLLRRLAASIGVQPGEGVSLTVLLPKKGGWVDQPMIVRNDHPAADAQAFGLLMPRRPPTKKAAEAPAKPQKKPAKKPGKR